MYNFWWFLGLQERESALLYKSCLSWDEYYNSCNRTFIKQWIYVCSSFLWKSFYSSFCFSWLCFYTRSKSFYLSYSSFFEIIILEMNRYKPRIVEDQGVNLLSENSTLIVYFKIINSIYRIIVLKNPKRLFHIGFQCFIFISYLTPNHYLVVIFLLKWRTVSILYMLI